MGRTPCCSADGLKKGAWTSEEDQKLIAYIQEHGEGGWRTLPQRAGLQRCGKSCRLRWANYLRPDIKRGEFTSEEEQKIIQLHATLGNRWSAIARHLPKRTDNEIKNYWNTHLKKRLLDTGVDPVTHEPIGSNSRASSSETDKAANKEGDQNFSLSSSSSMPSIGSGSGSAQLLNKLAAKLKHSQSFENIKESRSTSSKSKEGDINDIEDIIIDLSSISDTSTTIDSPPPPPPPPQQACTSLDNTMGPPPLLPPPQLQVTTNSRLLNKMASRLTTPLNCLTTLKSVLSKSINEGGNGNSINNNSNAIGDNSQYYMQRSTSTSCLNSESTTTTTNVALDPSELELLNWQLRASSNLIEGDQELGLYQEALMSDFMVTCNDQEFRATNNHEKGFCSNNVMIESEKCCRELIEGGPASFLPGDDHYITFVEEQKIMPSASSGDNSLNISYNNSSSGGEGEHQSLALFEDNTVHYWNEEYLSFDICGTPDSLVF